MPSSRSNKDIPLHLRRGTGRRGISRTFGSHATRRETTDNASEPQRLSFEGPSLGHGQRDRTRPSDFLLVQPRLETAMRDEWLVRYGHRNQIPPDLLSKRIVDYWRSQGARGSDISLILGTKQQHSNDDYLSHLESFLCDSDSRTGDVAQASRSELTQTYLPSSAIGEEIAWIDHRVWLDNVIFDLTIPQQPKGLLKVSDLQEALRTQVRLGLL